jgi:hypothetical protein
MFTEGNSTFVGIVSNNLYRCLSRGAFWRNLQDTGSPKLSFPEEKTKDA